MVARPLVRGRPVRRRRRSRGVSRAAATGAPEEEHDAAARSDPRPEDHPSHDAPGLGPRRRRRLPRGLRARRARPARRPGRRPPSAAPSEAAPADREADRERRPQLRQLAPLHRLRRRRPQSSPTLEQFTAKYGTKVNYVEAINDNESFFGTIQPPLQAGQDTGWDIIVLTDWMAARVVRLGWVETIDTANTPNFTANLLDVYRGVAWDPDTNLRAPWQSGMTGLGFDEAVTGNLTSLEALLDRRLPLEGQGLVPHRDAGHGRADAAEARLRARGLHDASRPTRRSPRSRRPSTPASSGASSATTTRRPSSRATSSSALRGRAT